MELSGGTHPGCLIPGKETYPLDMLEGIRAGLDAVVKINAVPGIEPRFSSHIVRKLVTVLTGCYWLLNLDIAFIILIFG